MLLKRSALWTPVESCTSSLSHLYSRVHWRSDATLARLLGEAVARGVVWGKGETAITNRSWQKQVELTAGDLLRTVKHFYLSRSFLRATFQSILVSRAHKGAKQGMRLERLRFELGMKLTSNEMRMIGQFNHFDVGSVWS